MNQVKKLNSNTMQEIKYYQGYSDAFASINPIFKELLASIKVAKDVNTTYRLITNSFLSIGELWKESNDRMTIYVDKLADINNLSYNQETQYLFVDEDKATISIKNN